MEKQNDIISVNEAMEMLGVKRGTIYTRIKEGAITPLPKPPGAVRNPVLKFRRADVQAFIDRQINGQGHGEKAQ